MPAIYEDVGRTPDDLLLADDVLPAVRGRTRSRMASVWPAGRVGGPRRRVLRSGN
jgi:hypothetical protein